MEQDRQALAGRQPEYFIEALIRPIARRLCDDLDGAQRRFARNPREFGMCGRCVGKGKRSEEHTSELQSLMRISYAVFCLKKKTPKHQKDTIITTQDK